MAVVVLVGACAAPPPPPDAGERTGRPVVLLDGWQIDCHLAGPGGWRTWLQEAARRRGTAADVSFFAYDACQPNSVAVDALGPFIDGVLARTGADRVDVVSHSMGSLVVRACIRYAGCAGKVDKFLALAPPNHGTLWAGVCSLAFWVRSTCDMDPNGPFLAALNSVDETWGDVSYVTMISWCDLTIVPFTSAALDGALDVVTDRCVGHTDWLHDDVAARWAFDWFDGTGPPPPAAAA